MFVYHSTSSNVLPSIIAKGLSVQHANENPNCLTKQKSAFNTNPDHGVCIAKELDTTMLYGRGASREKRNGLRCQGIPVTIRMPASYQLNGLSTYAKDCPVKEMEVSADLKNWYKLSEISRDALWQFHMSNLDELNQQNSNSDFQTATTLLIKFNEVCASKRFTREADQHCLSLSKKLEELIIQKHYPEAFDFIMKNLMQYDSFDDENSSFLQFIIQHRQDKIEKNDLFKSVNKYVVERDCQYNEILIGFIFQHLSDILNDDKYPDLFVYILKNYSRLTDTQKELLVNYREQRYIPGDKVIDANLYHIVVTSCGSKTVPLAQRQEMLSLLLFNEVAGKNDLAVDSNTATTVALTTPLDLLRHVDPFTGPVMITEKNALLTLLDPQATPVTKVPSDPVADEYELEQIFVKTIKQYPHLSAFNNVSFITNIGTHTAAPVQAAPAPSSRAESSSYSDTVALYKGLI